MKTHMPQEVWDIVSDNLPALSARYAARALDFRLRPGQQRHSRVWDAIFHDQAWIHSGVTEYQLNPVLIGAELQFCRSSSSGYGLFPTYLVLITGDDGGDFTNLNEEKQQLFLGCLQPHTFNERSHEVVFKSGMTLNVADVFCNPAIVTVRPDPRRLFRYTASGLHSSYQIWHDGSSTIGKIDSSDIVGIGGQASTLDDISTICGLTLPLANGQKTQRLFEKPGTEAGTSTMTVRLIDALESGWREIRHGWAPV